MRRLRRRRQKKIRRDKNARSQAKLMVEALEPRMLLSDFPEIGMSLRVTEVMYNPLNPTQAEQDAWDLQYPSTPYALDDNDFEYVELQNIGDTNILLSGSLEYASFIRDGDGEGFDFDFSGSTVSVVGPQEYILVVRNQNAFEIRYGTGMSDRIVGEFENDTGLNNGGENLTLVYDPPGPDNTAVIHEFDYEDDWYPVTDGRGFSLQIVDVTDNDPEEWDSRDGWRPSSSFHGTPGQSDEYERLVIINELLAHSHEVAPDWIEFYNPNENPIDISYWYLSDDRSKPDLSDPLDLEYGYTKYVIPAGTVIPGHGYLALDENTHFGKEGNPGVNDKFQFSDDGEAAYLYSADISGNLTGYFEERIFGASESNVSFGRYEKSTDTFNFVAMESMTPGEPNSDPKVGPVVISEIMYHPSDPTPGEQAENPLWTDNDFEYLELTNITGLPVILEEYDSVHKVTHPWKFERGIDFTFPMGTTIPAFGTLIVAKNPTAFTYRYGTMPSGVSVLGPFGNDTSLNNNGERLEISKPGEIPEEDRTGDDIIDEQDRVYIRMERVNYDDRNSWPTEPDGSGKSLTRIYNDQYGNDPINWKAAAPLNVAPAITTFADSPDPVTRGYDLTLSVTVSDPGDSISKVEFYYDSNGDDVLDVSSDIMLAVDNHGTDGWSWTGSTSGLPVGMNRYFARAQDDDEIWSATAITFGKVNSAPTIGSLSHDPDPVSQTSVLTLTAENATDPDGLVVSVEFYHDTNGNGALDASTDEWFGTDNNGSDGWSWSGALSGYSISEGPITYFARALDNDGAWSTEAVASGAVIPPNNPPTIGALSINPDPVTLGDYITLTAHDVVDSDGAVVHVRFYLDTNGNGSYDPYDGVIGADINKTDGWSLYRPSAGFSTGVNTFFARALDNNADWSNIASTTGQVESPNESPAVDSLTVSPDPVTEGESLTLIARDVTDSDGSIAQVEFYRDANGNDLLDVEFDDLLGTGIHNSPDWSWAGSTTGFAIGQHRYFVRAQDDDGQWSNGTITAIGQVIPANAAPTIGLLTDTSDPVNQGDDLTLTAVDVNDTDGTVTQVEFYHDTNDNNVLDVGFDDFLGFGTHNSPDWSWTGSTAGFTIGQHRYFVRAQDDDGEWSNGVITTTGQVAPPNEAPTIGDLNDNPDPVMLGRDLTLTAVGVADADGQETIALVAFYQDDGDGVFEEDQDTLLGEDQNGANGWSWTGSTAGWSIGDHTCFARVQDDFGDWSQAVGTTATIEEFFVDLTTYETVKQVVYTDTDLSTVTIKPKKLSAFLFFDNIDVQVEEYKGKVTIIGDTELNRMEIVNPAPGASLTFIVKGGDGMANLGGITGGYLDKLTGKAITLVGDVELTGYLGAVKLDDIDGSVSITTQQASPKGFSLKADVVNAGASFELADTVKKFQANRFENGLLMADTINKVTIKEGSFGADVFARNGDILSVSAPGDITGHLNADNLIKKITSKAGNFTGIARAGHTIGKIQAMNLDRAIISAGETIQKITSKNDISLSYILAGYDIGSDGLFGGGDIPGSGSVLSVSAKGAFVRSYIAAGVLPAAPLTDFLLNDVGVPADFGEIGKVSFGVVDPISFDDFGLFAATNIKSVKVKTGPSQTESQFIVMDMDG